MKNHLIILLCIPAVAGLLLLGGCAGHHRPAPQPAAAPGDSGPHPRALDHFIRGVVLDQQGEVTRAIGEYRRALLYDSTAASIYLAMAEDYYALKLYDDAVMQLQTAARMEPDNVQVLEFLSDLMMATGYMDSAVALMQRIIDLRPEDDRYHRNLAGLYLRLDRPAEAIAQYEAILDRNPEDVETLSQVSTMYIVLKDFEKALDASHKLYSLDSTDDRVAFTLASLLAELKQSEEADHYFARAVKLNPDDPRYYTNWAYLHVGNQGYWQAINILQKGTRHHPNAPDIWSLMGSAYERAGQDSLAVRSLDRALELDATQLGPYITLGFIHDRRGEVEKAMDIYAQGLAIAPEDPLLLNNYAYLLAERKIRLGEALTMVQTALQKSPGNPSYLDTAGWVYYGLGEYNKAREYLERALALDSENATILEHLGDVYAALGDKEAARDYWIRALQFDSANLQVREKLEK
ncbi:MAG: tetratricopeptide repeat protein [Candidatus Zixiibacteriota bacterium]|nr:MAG: tetratricopeptide repeat protein [candidate division Zixibacteria bacterium]